MGWIFSNATPLETRGPSRQFSLLNTTDQSPSNSPESVDVFWTVPDEYYNPPRYSPTEEMEDQIPEYEDPRTSLIVRRNVLVNTLYSRARLAHHTRDREFARLNALMSRITPSGHIKGKENMNPIKLTVQETLEYGDNHRSKQKLGNKRWPAMRARYMRRYASEKMPQPSALLREAMRERCQEGLQQALNYEEEFGMSIIYQPIPEEERQRGRFMKRTHPGAFNRTKVVTALMMLRNSYPDADFEKPASEPSYRKSLDHQKPMKAQVRTPLPSPKKDKRLSFHSNDSSESFGSFISADTFRSGRKKVAGKAAKAASFCRKIVSRIPRFGRHGEDSAVDHEDRGVKDVRDTLEGVSTSCNGSEDDADAGTAQFRLVRLERWIGQIDESRPIAPQVAYLEEELEEIEEQLRAERAATAPILNAPVDEAPKPALQEFSIDCGVVLPPEPFMEQQYESIAASAGVSLGPRPSSIVSLADTLVIPSSSKETAPTKIVPFPWVDSHPPIVLGDGKQPEKKRIGHRFLNFLKGAKKPQIVRVY